MDAIHVSDGIEEGREVQVLRKKRTGEGWGRIMRDRERMR